MFGLDLVLRIALIVAALLSQARDDSGGEDHEGRPAPAPSGAER